MKARDLFIGWDRKSRKGELKKVVGNSRFLLLPTIQVKNLASHVLSLAVKRLSNDWLERYNYAPALLETFVDSEYYSGTCYKAANWLYVGNTSGRGRQDSSNKKALSSKYIYLYPLTNDWRKILGGTAEPLEDPNKKPEPSGASRIVLRFAVAMQHAIMMPEGIRIRLEMPYAPWADVLDLAQLG